MSVNFMPAPGAPYGAAASSVGPGTSNQTPTMASPMAGLLAAGGANQGADPGMVKLAQAMIRARMKPPTPGAQIDPNGTGGMQGPVPLPQPGAPTAATAGLPPQ